MNVFTKPTLSRATFPYMDTPDKCRKWFYFFEDNLWKTYVEKNPSFKYAHSLWNCAQPTEWTPEDGKHYAKIAESVVQIQDEIFANCTGWKSCKSLVPEAAIAIRSLEHLDFCNFNNIKSCLNAPRCGGGCGAFAHSLVLIPNGRFTMCHRGLFDAYVDYANTMSAAGKLNNLAENFFQNINTADWVYDKEQLLEYHNMMWQIYDNPHQIWYTDLYHNVQLYAQAGIIDEKYALDKHIVPTLGYFSYLSSCIQDNFLMTGSWVTHTFLEIPLLYNGVMDIVIDELNRNIKKEKRVGEIE